MPLTIPEWSNHKGDAGDKPLFAQYMCDYMRQWAGTGPGRIYGDALFNLSSGYSAGLTQREIAARFGVSQQTISGIKAGKRWGHVE